MRIPYEVTAEAVLFDMDGTLVSSLGAAELTWTRLAEEAGIPAADVIEYAHGRQIVDSVNRFLPEYAMKERDRVVRQLMRAELEEAHAVSEITGASALMSTLMESDVPVALVTSAVRAVALARMQNAGVPIPPVIVSAEDVRKGKPAPDAYLQAAALLGVHPARCVVFEDAEAGLRAARACGAQVVVVGEHTSPATAGLARISGYRDARVVNVDGAARLTLVP